MRDQRIQPKTRMIWELMYDGKHIHLTNKYVLNRSKKLWYGWSGRVSKEKKTKRGQMMG